MRAYLEGLQSLRWMIGIIGHAEPDRARGLAFFNELGTYGDPRRREELVEWFREQMTAATSR